MHHVFIKKMLAIQLFLTRFINEFSLQIYPYTLGKSPEKERNSHYEI